MRGRVRVPEVGRARPLQKNGRIRMQRRVSARMMKRHKAAIKGCNTATVATMESTVEAEVGTNI